MIHSSINVKPKISSRLGFFRFQQHPSGQYVLTNDLGEHIMLTAEAFWHLVEKGAATDPETTGKLTAMGILRREDHLTAENIARYRNRNLFLFQGTSLHIIVVTLRCNLTCAYCQASARTGGEKDFDMTEETATRVVDTAFQSPSQTITLEFQGGEPLLNWPIIEHIVKYANKKSLTENKNVYYSLVTNLQHLTDHQLQFLVDNEIGITTSLDGPAHLHDLHRGAGSHQKTITNLIKAREYYKEKYILRLPGALMTMTRHSLPYPIEIIDQYAQLQQESIQLRKVSPFGLAAREMQNFDFTPQQYIQFYQQALQHIINLNQNGTRITERTAYLYLLKILTDQPVNHMDMRNPCGAAIGQIAYNHNGDAYTCDEGRMMSMMGDEQFRLGNVHQNTYQQLMDNDTSRTLCIASCLESIPACDLCAYKPWCGTCPIHNYTTEGDIFGRQYHNDRCLINKGIIDTLLAHAQNPDTLTLFKSWINDIVLI